MQYGKTQRGASYSTVKSSDTLESQVAFLFPPGFADM